MNDSEHKTLDQSVIQPRRLPMQARSRERVERILDAAAQLLQEDGYNSVKTNLIAKRAGVSIGSVYQFFPNRFAIFHALAARYQDRVAELLEAHMGPDSPDKPWDEALDNVIDTLAEMWRSDWAFHSVWLAIQNTAELREADEQYRSGLMNRILVHFLKRAIPDANTEEVVPIARVIFETTNLLLDHSIRDNPEQDILIIDELKFLLHSYIRGHIDSARAVRG